MRAFFACAVVGSLLFPNTTAARQPAATSVCQVIRDAAKLTGKRLRVEGYVLSLNSHGFVLTGKRRDCEQGQLVLRTARVATNQTWRGAFAGSLGPKRAILVGTLGWEKARYTDGRNPVLTIEQVVYLSEHEANLRDF